MEKYRQIRNYEVSVWTLQDSFITVLKWANIESKGQIQNGIQILDIDGTQEFNFTIPMYLSNPDNIGNNVKKENPIWYNTRNGVLMASMRKIKVILNKQSDDEKVYEYLIIKVSERHEKGELYCDVSCEGLAFHELGKIGYKLALSSDDFYYDYDKWFKEDGAAETEPHQTIQYWNNKFLTPYPEDSNNIIPNNWYYEIRMNWSSTGKSGNKYSNKVYEEEYVSSWNMKNNKLMPISISKLKEKERAIDIEDSNFYNITQKIAEIFEVFCKYEYEYDENYHIIARKVVYYNSLIEEQNGYLNLSYPFHTSKITREMDGTDLVTKMYIQVQDTDLDSINIMNVPANKSKEDYILNFDYLHDIKVITDEQYSEVEKYEETMFIINQELSTLNDEINIINNKLLTENTNKGVAEKEIQSAEEQINVATNNLKAVGTDENGTISITKSNAKALVMQSLGDGSYYVKMPFVGIIPTSVILIAGTPDYSYPYNPFDRGTKVTGTMKYDQYNNLTTIIDLSSPEAYGITTPVLWLQCEYVPQNYWNNVHNYWIIALEEYKEDLEKANQNIANLNNDLVEKETRYNELLEEKTNEKNRFNRIMGTALREGYWQPENYLNYSNKYLADFETPGSSDIYQDYASYFWDITLLKEEKDFTFKQGNITRQYLMIDLRWLSAANIEYIKNNYQDLSFIYYDPSIVELNQKLSSDSSDYQNNIKKAIHSIHLQSGCKFGFVIDNGGRIPVLAIIDSNLFTNEQLLFFSKNSYDDYESKIGVINRTVENGVTNITIDENAINISRFWHIFGGNNTQDRLKVTYPKVVTNLRVAINSLALNTSSSELFIKLDNTLLQEYVDYYITKDYNKIYITIKPETLFKIGYNYTKQSGYSPQKLNPPIKIAYSLSSADVAIYLDAIKIAKENAYPRVSYDIDLNIFDGKIIHNIYNRLAQIIHINDNELKFENVYGYISRIEMDLDHPWQDKIEVKNYKTKFEDLFSTIVASTEAIKKNEYNYNLAAAAFNGDGTLRSEILTQTLNNNTSIINNYLNNNFGSIDIINNKLESIFNEAGLLLSTAGNSLMNIQSLSTSNANILSGFYAGVQEGFANGINYTSDYTFVTGEQKETTVNISAVRINKDEGIYIGSNKKIILSATNAIRDSEGNYIGDPEIDQSGADVELSPKRLLMGVSNLTSNDAGVVDITSRQILLTVGNMTGDLEENSNDITNSILSGVQIRKDYIGLAATDNQGNRSIISIKPKNILLGTKGANQAGSYIEIAQDKLELGSAADLKINTNNFKLQTNYSSNNSIGNTIFAIGSNLYQATSETNINNLTSNDSINFLINQSGTFINGTLIVAGKKQSNYYPFFKVENNTMGIFRSSTGTTNLDSQDVDKLLYFENGKLCIKGDIIASSFQLSGDAIEQFNTAVSNVPAVSDGTSSNTTLNQLQPLVTNGISSGMWNGTDYGVILGNASNSKPMLIGSNSGLMIAANSNSELISLTKDGIALHGGTINLTTVNNTNKNIISLSEAGINLASTAEINMETGGKFNISADTGAISLGDYFTIDSEGNLRCKSITCETLNGLDASNSITDQGSTTTVYGSGSKIWFSGTPQIVYGSEISSYTINNINITLANNIEANTLLRIKLGFADSQGWFFISGVNIILNNRYAASATVYWDNDSRTGKIGQGRTSVTSEDFSFGDAVSAGEYSCKLTIIFPYAYSVAHTWYPNQSYIEII